MNRHRNSVAVSRSRRVRPPSLARPALAADAALLVALAAYSASAQEQPTPPAPAAETPATPAVSPPPPAAGSAPAPSSSDENDPYEKLKAMAVAPPPPPAPERTSATQVAAPERASEEPSKKGRAAKTDHEQVVGRVGIGFLGVADLPLPAAISTGTEDDVGLVPNDGMRITRVSAPAIGARIWLTNRVGIDTGIGFWYSGGETSSELGDVEASIPKQSVIAFLVHGGVPVVVADTRHMALQLVPEVTFGMARSNVEPMFDDNAPSEADLRGYRLDVGLRGGAELHFGFMGLPELTLEAGIGLVWTTEWASASAGNQSVSDVSTRVSTTSFADPWDIFGGFANVAARYYF